MPDERDRSVSHDIEVRVREAYELPGNHLKSGLMCAQSSEAPSPVDTPESQIPAVGKPGRKKNPKYDPYLLSVMTCSRPPACLATLARRQPGVIRIGLRRESFVCVNNNA